MHRARRACDLVRERAQRELSLLAAALLAELPVHRILAFGSFARGDMHEHSDLDLLLVGDFTDPPRLRERAVREIAWRLGISTPIEVIACTPAELEAARDRPFLAHVLKEAVEVPLPSRTQPSSP
jgi:predicted nucleotidyltransferase